MGCAFDKELLTGYYDGELDGAEKAKVERHIAGCSECLRDLGEIRSVSQLVRKLSRPGLPRKASEGIARALEGERAARRRDRWQRRLVWSMAAAAGVFLALNVAYFLRVERSGGREDLAPAIGHLQAPEESRTFGKRESLKDELLKLKEDRAAPEAKSEPPLAVPPPAAVATKRDAPPAPPAPERPKSLAAAPPPPKDKEVQGLQALEEKALRAPAVPEEKSAPPKPAAPIAGEETAEQIARIRNELQNVAGIRLVLAAPDAASGRRKQAAESLARPGADAGAAAPVPPAQADSSVPARVRLVLHLLPAEPEKK